MRLALVIAVAACGDNRQYDEPFFAWDGQATVGAMALDHLLPDDPGMFDQVDAVVGSPWVAMFYAHIPGEMSRLDTLEALIARATDDGLPMLTYRELAEGPPRGGVSLSFDDTEVDQWMLLRPMLQKYDAHVTFFVTRYFEFTDAQKAELHQLYAEGNSIEAHGVNHVDEKKYVAQYGLEQLIAEEIVPSIEILRADGFDPHAFAHPGGAHTREIDEAILEHIDLVRSISGAPKRTTH